MGLSNFYFILQFSILLLLLAVLQIIRGRSGSRFPARLQIFILLLYSFFFLGYTDWKFCLSLGFAVILSYSCGLLMDHAKAQGAKNVIAVWGGIGLMTVLAYFKYANFFIESFHKAFGLNTGTWEILVPAGLSFFIFSALSYVIDVWRGTCRAEKNILDFGLYMAFFPKITAGPIIRWTEFKPQVKQYRGIKLQSFHDGIQIFVFGLFKKIVLADHLGVFVDDVFFAPGAYDTGTIILSAVSYSLQIYLDFSGYSDMAAGLAKILGFEFGRNFNLPYMARGFSDFWNRWHISLSGWFRDYLYIPLGGSRNGEVRAYINLFFVMIISGLWHGAGWTFILWGMLHGMAGCLTRWLRKKNIRENGIFKGVEVLATFFLTTLFWIVFRAESIGKAVAYWKAMFTLHGGISLPYTWTFFAMACVAAATLAAGRQSYKEGESDINGFYPLLNLSKVWPLALFFTFCGLTVLLGYYGNTAFIYGGF